MVKEIGQHTKEDNMEPHLKAKELIEKFGHYTKFYNDRTESIDVNLDDAKQCALICVDEIMKELGEIDQSMPVSLDPRSQYYLSVKEEIIKL